MREKMKTINPIANHRKPPAIAIGLTAAIGLAGLLGSASTATGATGVNGQIAYTACGGTSTNPAFSTQCDIWVMAPDGSGQTNVTNTSDSNEVSPAWSPDGTWIAYFEGSNGIFNLRLIDADGSNPSPVITTTFSYPYTSTPTWSPDGTRIAFVRNNPGSPVSPQADIVVIDLQTLVETVISRPADFGGVLLDADEYEPAWSPDGGKIAFVGVRLEEFLDPVTGTPTTGAQAEIVTVNPDGSGEQIVSAGSRGTDRAQFLEEDRAPAWSPDGSMLVFMSQDQIQGCCGPWQIWAVNRDGTGATNLTNDATVNDMFPSWSPDGTQIVFSRSDGPASGLYTMPAPASLPLATPLAATRLATGGTALATTATPLPTNGDASDPDWGRQPGTPPNLTSFALNVSVSAFGRNAGGSVSSQPKGINCGRDCSEIYAAGTVVTLTARPRGDSSFAGWSGACAGAGENRSCQVTMNDVKTVGANFARAR